MEDRANPRGGTATLVFVGGTARSGSTALDLMLGGGDDAFSCGEVVARYRPTRTYHLTPSCRCGDPGCPTWAELAGLRSSSFHCGVVKRLGVHTVVDSSKSLSWFADSARWARRCDLNVALVLVWKEPVDLAHSFYKRSPVDGSIHNALRNFVGYYSMALSLGLTTRSVRNLDLQTSPAATLHALSSVLDLSYRDGQERFWETDHHHLFGSDSAAIQVRTGSPLADPPYDDQFAAAWDRIRPHYEHDLAAVRQALVNTDTTSPTPAAPHQLLTGAGIEFTRARYLHARLHGLGATASLALRHPQLYLTSDLVRSSTLGPIGIGANGHRRPERTSDSR